MTQTSLMKAMIAMKIINAKYAKSQQSTHAAYAEMHTTAQMSTTIRMCNPITRERHSLTCNKLQNQQFGLEAQNLADKFQKDDQSSSEEDAANNKIEEIKVKFPTKRPEPQNDGNVAIDLGKIRENIINLYIKGAIEECCNECSLMYKKVKDMLQNAEKEAQNARVDLEAFIGSLMYARSIILTADSKNKFDELCECLKRAYELFTNWTKKFDFKTAKNTLKEEVIKKDSLSMRSSTKKKYSPNSDIAELKTILYIYSIFASFFNYCGFTDKSEDCYLHYAESVEKLYGQTSLESSNCYFMLGVFYFECRIYEKALICFKKAMNNREKILGKQSQYVADCHYNIGMIYSKTKNFEKALSSLNNSLSIRKTSIGCYSYAVSESLEQVAKISIQLNDLTTAYNSLQECLEIRKKIIKNSKEPAINRINLYIAYIDKVLSRRKQPNAMPLNDTTQSMISRPPTFSPSILKLNQSAYSESVDMELGSVQLLLSFDTNQLKILNSTQYSDIIKPFYISDTLRQSFDDIQNGLLNKSSIGYMSRSSFYSTTQNDMTFTPIKLKISHKLIEKLEDIRGSSSGYFDILINNYNTLISKFEHKIRKSQSTILHCCFQYDLNVAFFISSLKDDQQKSVSNIIQREWKIIESNNMKQIELATLKSAIGEKQNENRTSLEIRLCTRIDEFETTDLIENINIQFTQKMIQNCHTDTIFTIEKLRKMVLDKADPEGIFKAELKSLLETLSDEQLQEFAISNQFLIESKSSPDPNKTLTVENTFTSPYQLFSTNEERKESPDLHQAINESPINNPEVMDAIKQVLSDEQKKMLQENPSILFAFTRTKKEIELDERIRAGLQNVKSTSN